VDPGAARRIEVHIGTIEIQPVEPSTPLPPPAAAAEVGPQAHVGFDDFVALRTYAAWDR